METKKANKMRVEKIAILNEVVERVKSSDYCFVINYGGVEVTKMTALRTALRAHGSRLLVVKNTYLAKIAKEKGWPEDIKGMFFGPTAVVTGNGEITDVAKDVMDFVKGSDGKATVKGADFDGKLSDAATVEALSAIPGKDQLRATFLMLLKEPATRIARVLSEKAKKEGGEAAPAEAAAQA